MKIELRPYSPDDQDFIFKLYASTRLHEIAPFGWDTTQQEVFLRMQFNAQKRWYDQAYPNADHQIILLDGQPAGRIMVMTEPESSHLIEIALLPELRNHGIGAKLVGDLVEKSTQAGKIVRLQVLRTNPAIHLYERLGFVKTGEDAMYFQMATSNGIPDDPIIRSPDLPII
ncbi:MAG: GNAT family N-acetyltransferase [Candidatus Angelobacter sp. Gp1-AA117]|nr:MAG: GNAT family N-acetyltransferase [Candidatus Angelobacter sp. Gp1-AA117]